MKIKGHTKIELRNIKTGKVETIEKDNLVTNALAYYLKDIGVFGRSPLLADNDAYNSGVRDNPIINMMGGLLLLDTALTESADNIILPGGVKMIGNGSYNVTADGQDGVTELGSWNSVNSGWKSDGKYVMEWDFSAEQANTPQGKSIACVCLTSAKHGYIGEGNINPSGAARSEKKSDTPYYTNSNEYTLDVSTNAINRVVKISATDSTATFVNYYNYVYDAQHAEDHMSLTGKLKLTTKKIPFTKLDLRESFPANNNGGDIYIPTTETEIPLPSAFLTQLGNRTPWLGGKHGDYYYLLARTMHQLAVGASVQGVKIDCSTLTATPITITNTLDDIIVMTSDREACVMFGNNTAAVKCRYGASYGDLKEGFFFQDLTHNEDTSFVQNTNMTSGSELKMHMHEDWCIYNWHKIDFTDRTVLPVNGSDSATMGTPLVMENPLLEDYIPYNQGYWTPTSLRLYHCTDYLATINNLQEPIQKTSEKTMKVTYTISFDDGE